MPGPRVHSAGNDWSGMFHGDYEHESFVGENIDEALASRGYTGNPNLLFRAAAGESRSPLFAEPLVVGAGGHGRIWQNHSLDVDFRQQTTNWGGRLLARVPLPYGVGFSANVRHQSGWPYALIQRVDIPGVGTNQPIFLSNLSANRSENVTLVDLSVERVLDVGSGGRLTLMADVYNALNSNAVTNFSLRTGDDRRVIAALDPIALKLGARFQF